MWMLQLLPAVLLMYTPYIKSSLMMGLGNTSKGVSDKPALKAKRFKFDWKWDATADRGAGRFTKKIKTASKVKNKKGR